MNNGKQSERWWKVMGLAGELVLTEKRKPDELADVLQQFISVRFLEGDVHPIAIAEAAERAEVLCFEDDTSQHSAIETLPQQVCGQTTTIPINTDPDEALERVHGKAKTLHDVVDCCLTDVMFDGQPRGLAVATHAISCGMPCVIVTRSIEGGSHHPLWVRHALRDLAQHPFVAVYESTGESGPKPWLDAYIALMGFQWKYWLADPSQIGDSVRRYQKNVIEGKNPTGQYTFVIRGRSCTNGIVYLCAKGPLYDWASNLDENTVEFKSRSHADEVLGWLKFDRDSFLELPHVVPVPND